MRPRRFLGLVPGLALIGSVLVLTATGADAATAEAPAAALPATTPIAATPAAAPAAAAPAPDRMPGDVPTKKTPWVLDGAVYKVVQVGDTMIAGGLFTTVGDPMNGPQYARQNLFAFDATTGVVSQTFNPTVDGAVQQLLPGPTEDTVYVAGDFTKINNKGPNHLQLLNVNTGLADTSFKAPATNGGIATIEKLPNNRLFIGGFFTKIGGVSHGQIASLNASTGAFDSYMDIVVSGRHNTGTGARAPIGPREADVTPAGDRMIIVGNFRTVGGYARDQIVMINLGTTSATVAETWYTTGYTPICSPSAFDSYMRDVEVSPDGSYFVVATTGGPHSGTLCDTAARFETYAIGTALTPTWTDTSGGDTLWGVEITQAAVYIGGHNRWMNNPNGSDRAAQGAVPRPGLSALDPETGVPLKWNPGRNPRGVSAFEIYETETGVWVVSDTDWIGSRQYRRPRIAFFPYSEGSNIASKNAGALPGNIYVAAPDAIQSSVLYRVNAGGSTITATDGGPNWSSDSGTTSTFRNTGSSISSYTGTVTTTSAVPAGTPLTLFNSERYDPAGGNEMLWNFTVPAGTATEVRLYFANRCTCTQSPGQRRFNVNIDGQNVLNAYDIVADTGATNRGTMKSFTITSDGIVNIDFIHNTPDNPLVNGIEIIKVGAAGSTSTASIVSYDGTTVNSNSTTVTPNVNWSTVRGAVMVGRTLFYGQTDNMLYRRSFDGVNFGDPVQINPYLDPAWSTVETGSGPVGQTYAGVLPTWYSQLSTVTGMFYWNGRLYYTLSGQNTLFWRWFSTDSGIVSPVQNTVTGGNVTWSSVRGMFLDGNNLYTVATSNGALSRISFVNGAPSGTSTVVNSTATGGIDWRGRALFLASLLPNVAPSAEFTFDCTGINCIFDGTLSADTDGTIASYEWDFGDGDQGGGPNPEKDFLSTGTYDVTLTVTDDGGLSSTITHPVSVEKPNEGPTADFSTDCSFLDCDFDGTLSVDGDGTVDQYAWDFGDGQTSTESVPNHVYGEPGVYDVLLTVTDDDDATDDVTKQITVNAAPEPSTVSYVGGAVSQGNVTTPNVTLPTTVSAGDRLILVLSVNGNSKVLSEPTGVTGWTVLDTTTSGTMQTRVYTKIAEETDANKRVTVTLDTAAKYTMTVADYSGVRGGSIVYADFAETVNQAAHATPIVVAPPGAWVVSYWADKSSATTAFTLPNSVTSRHALCAMNTGRICSSLADSNGSVPAGQYGGLVGTADSPSASATTWSIVLRTQGANQAPTADFTFTCDGADCDFDGSDSSDSDGTIASYGWDFGDGDTATGASPSHDFVTSGTRDVTLTVTDDEGTSGSIVIPVSVVRNNAAPTASFTVSCDFLICSFDAEASTDTDGTVESYEWDFGDGQTGNGVTATHPYAAGNYTVTLVVTDNDAGTGTTTRPAEAVEVRPIAFVGSTANQGNVATPNTTIPAGTSAGDRMVMMLSINSSIRVVGDPTTVTGWNPLGSITSGSMATYAYTKSAAAGDAGRTVRIPMDMAAKYTLTVATYSGDMLAPQFAGAAETVSRTTHSTPNVEASAGDWAVSYWADKSSATTGFNVPSTVTERQETCAPTTGRICSSLADSAGPVTAGTYGGLGGESDAAAANATMWTILLRQDS